MYVKAGWKIFFLGHKSGAFFQSKWLEIKVYKNELRNVGVVFWKVLDFSPLKGNCELLALHAVSDILKPTRSDNRKRNNRPFLKMNVN
jgi:hypothetical protein